MWCPTGCTYILGPILFSLYVNDMVDTSNLLKFVLFADDTNIYYSCRDLHVMSTTVNDELMKLSEWFKINKLSLNLQKTTYMVFSKRKTYEIQPIIIDGVQIEQSNKVKFLGVIVDQKLSWKEHILYVRNKLSSILSVLYRASHIIDVNSMLILYRSLFLPHLSYCSEVWGNTCSTFTKSIFVAQKKAVRLLMTNKVSSDIIFKHLKLLKFADIVKLNTVSVAHAASLCKLPVSIQAFYNQKPVLDKTRNIKHFLLPLSKCNLKHFSVICVSIKLWNSLALSTQLCKTKHNFKRIYKEKLIDLY